MEEPNSDDWLPPGWTVEVRVRKNGKRDKYYFSPSNGLKFNSKVEVFRYLDNAQNKVSIQKISSNVVVEKAIAEGLPPGWVKKTRITTKGDTVRRDPYYIDPLSGYTFRSIKDVDRHLQSGVIRRSALKPKDKDGIDMELKAGKSLSASVTLKPTLSVSMGQSSDLNMIANDQQTPRPASSGEYKSVPISDFISNQLGTELTSSVLSGPKSSDQKEGKVCSGCTNEDAQEKQLQENSETKHGTEKSHAEDRHCKNKHKKDISLPRRTSKRLAGIKVDPVPELKTRNRSRRASIKQSSEEETITIFDNYPNSLPDGLAKQFNVPEGGSEINCKSIKSLEVQRSDKHKECISFSPPKNSTTVEECVRVLENGDKVDAKLDYTLDYPLRELLTDPCIAFAIQTLTGVTFETTKNSQTSSDLKTSQHSETSAAATATTGVGEGHGKKSHDVFSSPKNIAIPQEPAGDAKTNDKAKNENAGGPSSEEVHDMSWMDPCIEFAIKTLTGTIPLDSDQKNPKNCLQQQLNSSINQHSEKALSSSFVDPSLQHTRNVGIGNSAGARLSHCGEDTRRNVC
ncbi:uncharacterized protein LOC109790523 isoform X2 [Cajanus cajan]|uniref:uncharacterized protein LOC109790523 isoform X2 n=1 Tax=Cajanus cajan TaxID=3821 RepID=UPI00098D7E56|nr:uncharacterized protein LOC109790523 isoform X2 [Cajanus cajan]